MEGMWDVTPSPAFENFVPEKKAPCQCYLVKFDSLALPLRENKCLYLDVCFQYLKFQ